MLNQSSLEKEVVEVEVMGTEAVEGKVEVGVDTVMENRIPV